MMRILILFCCLLVSVSEAEEEEPIVIVISMDGVPYKISDNPKLNAFKRMEKYGTRADHLIPVYQSTT